MMSDFKILTTEIRNGIAIVTIKRPEALNALNTLFFEEMDQLVAQLSQDPNIRVMLITGEGKAFVAGADIAEMVDKTDDEGTDFGSRGQETFRSLELLPFPVIAAINGFALGGGLELAMACDIRIASAKAKFGQPEVNLGLTPGFAGTQRLPRLVGLGNALYLLTSAEMIDAQTALRMGLIQQLVEPDHLLDEALKLAETIAKKGPQAVSKVKMLAHKAMETDLETGSELEAEYFGSLFGENSEGREGMQAFLEKRKPNW
jgi:enoyl-CoA hydratase